MIKAELSASLLQSSVSHDPSEIILICWFAAQETCIIIINTKNSCAALYFSVNHDAFLSVKNLWRIESSREQHLSEVVLVSFLSLQSVLAKRLFLSLKKSFYYDYDLLWLSDSQIK